MAGVGAGSGMAPAITSEEKVVELARGGDQNSEILKRATVGAVSSAIDMICAKGLCVDDNGELNPVAKEDSAALRVLFQWGDEEQRFKNFYKRVNDEKWSLRKSVFVPDSGTETTTTPAVTPHAPGQTAPAPAAPAPPKKQEVDANEAIALAIARECTGSFLQFQADRRGRNTIVHLTAAYGSRWLFEQLVRLARNRGADMEPFWAKDAGEKTPMAVAAERGPKDPQSADIVNCLLDVPGVDIDEDSSRYATRDKSDLLFHFIAKRPGSVTTEWIKAAMGGAQSNPRPLDELIRQRAHHDWGNNLLFLAIEQRNITVVKKLLAKHPDLAIRRKAIVGDGAGPGNNVPRREEPPLYFVAQIKDAVLREQMRSAIAPHVIRHSAVGPTCALAAPKISLTEEIRVLLAEPPGQRKEISLDLGGFKHSDRSIENFLKMISASSRTATVAQAQQPLLNVEFETTLRFVHIAVPKLPRQQQEHWRILVRSEVKQILDWLYGVKGVRGIYELRIRDSLYIPHCEEMIEACLQRFDIEVLDWMRADMSLRPVMDTCPNLREITLYASTWASAQAWTSKEGMQTFRDRYHKLTKVTIVILQDLVGKRFAKTYQTDITNRLDRFFNITVQPHSEAPERPIVGLGVDGHPHPSLPVSPPMSPSSPLSPSPPSSSEHRRLERDVFTVEVRNWPFAECADQPEQRVQKLTARQATRLTEFIPKYEALQRQFQDEEWRGEMEIVLPEEPSGHMPYIKVAVIDTGVDPTSVKCHGISGASFVSSGSSGGESPWWYAQELHGTQVARIITELDPFCELLVAKVGDAPGDMTTARVTKAFEWAIRSGADIISMSATVKKDDLLRKQVVSAIGENIVVLGSTAGEGYNNTEAWPAGFESVISIASASLDGTVAPGSIREAAKYLFTGENLTVSVSVLGSEPQPTDVQGTSFANAIAAGVASLLLACRRLALSRQSLQKPWNDFAGQRHEFVQDMFKKMARESNQYVKPWEVFHQNDNQPSWGEAHSTLEWIRERFLKPDERRYAVSR